MSGDVQPRKRKDKKRKKDELSVEEPRGTAAALGEGDVFIHSHHEHGTGGHWCAKIIFFSLLAVLITLIGLIILENRGLTDLEAKSVETPYSGVLEGWLEDVPDDNHHDEHTLELKHNEGEGEQDYEHSQEEGHDDDDEDDDHSQEVGHDDDDEDYDHSREIGHDDDDDEEPDDRNEIEQQSDEDDANDEYHENNDDDDGDDNDDQTENDDDDGSEEENQYETAGDQQDAGNSEEQDLEDAHDEDDDQDFAYRRYMESTGHQRKNYEENDEDDDEDGDDDGNEIADDLRIIDNNDSRDNDKGDGDDENDRNVQDDRSIEKDDDDDFDKPKEDVDDDDSLENDYNKRDENSYENEPDEHETNEEDEEEHEDVEEADSGVEVEKLEKEISDEDALSTEEPELAQIDDDDKSQEVSNEEFPEDDADVDEEEYLEVDEIDDSLPEVENIKVPAGKPLAEVEENTSSEKPPDTLAEEEEYEKRQEELRREKAEASHIWLKLVVGGALLVATHAVVRRATAPRDTAAIDEHAIREETPLIDRRMTLIPGEAATPAPTKEVLEETVPPTEEEFVEKITPVVKSAPPTKQESEEDEEEVDEEIEEIDMDVKNPPVETVKEIESVDKELYSDEEEAEDEEEEEEVIVDKKESFKQIVPTIQQPVHPEPEPEADDDDDVEIIDDEQFEEELEEEDEDDISDVDDAELLSRLEAKYGRLPEPHRPEPKHKDGGNSIEDEWPGEPSEAYWRQQLDRADNELRQRASAQELKGSARGKWIVARALDASAEAGRDNALLTRAIAAYLELLKMNERLSDTKLLKITDRTLDRMRFRGNYIGAEPVYRLLIRRFPDDPIYRNNLTVNFLMANRADLAGEVIKETLKKWPDDRVALAQHGFVLKTVHNRLEKAVDAFQKALKDDVGPATEPRFYYHLGDALLLLGRFAEAHEVHKRGAALGHFLSPAQRSLYNVERLKSRPWWNIEQTPYLKLARALERSWKEILKEGEAASASYEREKEGLKERGEWSQLDLFMRGREVPGRCSRAPVTCSVVRAEAAAAGCRRGQVKFSLMQPGTHVRPHVGPTNCRLRMHLGLSNTKDTYIRVDKEIRQWQVGKTLMFDDSFEHEVWHNGTAPRLVLIVDVWHPDLTPAERRALPAI